MKRNYKASEKKVNKIQLNEKRSCARKKFPGQGDKKCKETF
jgi:hypothetical protein